MHDTRAFAPLYRASSTVAAGELFPSVTVVAADATAVASTQLPGQTSSNNNVQIRIANKTSVWVHVNFGVLALTVRAATINDLPIAPGGVEIVSVPPEVNAASVYANGAPAASTSVIFTRGDGV